MGTGNFSVGFDFQASSGFVVAYYGENETFQRRLFQSWSGHSAAVRMNSAEIINKPQIQAESEVP